MSDTRPIKVGFYLYNGLQALDAVGPFEILFGANEILRKSVYELHLFSEQGQSVRGKSGMELGPCRPVSDIQQVGPLDTFFVPGGDDAFKEYKKSTVLDLIRRQNDSVRRLCSVCSGSIILAEAGLLDGKRATSHWAVCNWMAENYPNILVDADAIYVKADKIYTSAGVTAGMDLALALVEEDFGHEVALKVARRKVMFMKRPGGQSQFSTQLKAQFQEKERDRNLAVWILNNIGTSLTVDRMAQEVGMSARSFARYFAKTFGETPARFVENCRIESARRLLEESDQTIDQVAVRCGFTSAEIMRRSFHRHLHISPADYRSRFSSQVQA